jgi:hypothetical protein
VTAITVVLRIAWDITATIAVLAGLAWVIREISRIDGTDRDGRS